jgi:hypothetical protein
MGQEFVKISKVLTSGKLTGRKKFSATVKDCVASLRFLITSQDIRTKNTASRRVGERAKRAQARP